MTAVASAHTRYGTRLAALASDDGALGPGFDRVYARFHPHRDPFATLVLRESGEPRRVLRVEAFDARPPGETIERRAAGARPRAIVRGDAGAASATLVRSEAGWLRLTAFPSDPALRTLPALLARSADHPVVRYRPTAYEEAAGPLDARLIAIYLAHRRLAKAVRVASSLRPEGDRRAERQLERAVRELGGPPA